MKFICQYRRKLMFSKLVKYPLYLVMAHEKPDVKFHPDTVIKPPMNFPETMKFSTNSWGFWNNDNKRP